MKLRGKTWQISIFIKLIAIFLTVIIPLYALSLAINEWGADRIKNEITKSMMSKLHFYLHSLEVEVSHIENRQLEYLNDYDINMISVVPHKLNEYEKSNIINDIHMKLRLMANSSIYIKKVSVHIPLLKKTISSDRLIADLQEDEFNTLKATGSFNNSLIFRDGRIFMSFYYPDPILKNRKVPMFLVEVELSKTELKKALLQFSGYPGDGFILLNQKQDWFITNREEAALLSPLNQYMQGQFKIGIHKGMGQMNINNKRYLLIFEKSDYLGMALLAYVPEEEIMGPLKDYRSWFWVLSAISIIILVFFSYTIYRLIYQPLHKLVYSFGKVDRGELDISINHRGDDEFRYLYEHFNIMVDKLKKLIRQVYEEQLLLQRAELRHLQAQINPHFLYNSFFIMHRMIKSMDIENATRFSLQLGTYYQFITRNAADEVPLDMEIRHARTYVEIQSIRFSDHIKVDFNDFPEAYEKLPVPRFILQPIIENAYEHGLRNKINGGKIIIGMSAADNRVYISVEDNGEEMDDDKLEILQKALAVKDDNVESTGIINIHRRLQLKYGAESGISISRSLLGGLKVEMHILCKQENGDVSFINR